MMGMTDEFPLQLGHARALFAASAEAMLIVGEDGRIVYANGVAASLFGFAPEELTGREVDDLVPADSRGDHANHRASYAGNPYGRTMAASEQIHALRRDGSTFPVEISLSPLELEGRSVVVAAVVDISERIRQEAVAHAANELSQHIIASANEGIIVFDRNGHYRLWNPFMEAMTGIAERDVIGRFPHEVFPFLEEVGVTESIQRALAGETVTNPPFEWSVPQSGRSGWAVSTQAPLRNSSGAVIGVVDIVHDITEAKRAQDQLQLAATVYRALGEAIFVADAENRIIAVNPAFSSLTGYSEEEALGQPTSLLKSDRHPDTFYRDMWHAVESTGNWQGEIWNRHKDGQVSQEWLAITTVYGDNGEVLQRIGALSNITDRKRTAETVWKQGSFDPLTGLPNRRMFKERLERELERAKQEQRVLALLFVDLDNFKEVNDSLGHTLGDLLLQETASRLTTCVRDADTVARLGGDEFTVILAGLEDGTGAERVAESIRRAMVTPFTLGERMAAVSASIGIAFYPDDAENADDLVKRADQEMYTAKRTRRSLIAGRGR